MIKGQREDLETGVGFLCYVLDPNHEASSLDFPASPTESQLHSLPHFLSIISSHFKVQLKSGEQARNYDKNNLEPV